MVEAEEAEGGILLEEATKAITTAEGSRTSMAAAHPTNMGTRDEEDTSGEAAEEAIPAGTIITTHPGTRVDMGGTKEAEKKKSGFDLSG